MNAVYLIGRMGSSAELKKTQNGKSICSFSIATNDTRGEEKITYWHRIVIFNKTAEMMAPLLKKGVEVFIQGKLCPTEFTDKNGNKRYNNDILANYVRVSQDLKRDENQTSFTSGSNFEDSYSDIPF